MWVLYKGLFQESVTILKQYNIHYNNYIYTIWTYKLETLINKAI